MDLFTADFFSALLAIIIPYLGSLSTAFGFVPLPSHLLAIGLTIVAAYVCATELAKHHFYGATVQEAPRAEEIR